MGPLTWATIALLTLFGAIDGAAHLTKYKYGLKVVVAAACILLGVHLVFHLP